MFSENFELILGKQILTNSLINITRKSLILTNSDLENI